MDLLSESLMSNESNQTRNSSASSGLTQSAAIIQVDRVNNEQTKVAPPNILNHHHQNTVQQINHFKGCVSEKIQKLEQLVKRLKTLVLVAPNSAMMLDGDENESCSVGIGGGGIITKPAKVLSNTSELVTTEMKELRVILTEIDMHLSVLKEVEQRHALACETYSNEISAREETLQMKIKQINDMNRELCSMQNKIKQLNYKNQQLEMEINFIKTNSSMTNTETSTPINNEMYQNDQLTNSSIDGVPLDNKEENSQLLVMLDQIHDQQNVMLQMNSQSNAPVLQDKEAPTISTRDQELDYKSLYQELLKQYKQIEKLVSHNENKPEKAKLLSQVSEDVPKQTGDVIVEQHFGESVGVETNVTNGTSQVDQASMEHDQPDANNGTKGHRDSIVNELQGGDVPSDNDVVATSIKAYEHFVKMQHDLETLMKNEERARFRIDELEKLNTSIMEEKEEDEFKLSEVQYELDILKHNYNLEIESFGTAINERESLIEKLQQKVESLKRRYVKLDERLKVSIETEVQYKSSIEEFEGRLKYEQLQKQTVIDSRVHELENKLSQMETEYQLEIKNLKTDLSCQVSLEKDLRKRIDELEDSLKSMGTPEFEEEFVYYKNQIDSLVKELDCEKQDKQRLVDGYEEEIRLKDKQLDSIRELAKKENDAMLREKTEFEQRHRKLNAKLKAKEQEIQLLQEKLRTLNDKLKNSTINPCGDGGQMDSSTPTIEQLMAELSMNEMQMVELKNEIENGKEQIEQLNDMLCQERDRRKQLDSYYLSSINNRSHGESGLSWGRNGIDSVEHCLHHLHHLHHHHSSTFNHYRQDDCLQINSDLHHASTNTGAYRRDSMASLALLMDDNEKLPRQKSLINTITRTIRRQKNIILFGEPKAKGVRLVFFLYLIVLHYFAVEYYINH